ncbi:Tartrate-resistant acid phosphatase type 5 [Lamellibrachia satsuma]|nr:Tartrate-resistant acid phosphatase type 5 [Lamellibrachia satsuma]
MAKETIVAVAVVFACVVFLSQTQAGQTKNSINFLALGDFGGSNDDPFTTPVQLAVAAQAANFANKNPVDFVLTLGDNFYTYGVKSVDDPRFTETYSKVYYQRSLAVDWYITAGNHDYKGNVSAQIAYTKVSKTWNYPDNFYKKKFTVPDSDLTLEIIMIDTIILCGQTDDDINLVPTGPKSVAHAKKYWKWIKKQIKHSTADYLIVAGHYPVFSVGHHGPTQELIDLLMPLLHANNVTAYLSGHDHNLQHLQSHQQQSTVDYFVSGAAAKVQPIMTHKGDVPIGSLKFFAGKEIPLGGFGHVEMSKENMTFTFSDSHGKTLYQHVMFPRHVRK